MALEPCARHPIGANHLLPDSLPSIHRMENQDDVEHPGSKLCKHLGAGVHRYTVLENWFGASSGDPFLGIVFEVVKENPEIVFIITSPEHNAGMIPQRRHILFSLDLDAV